MVGKFSSCKIQSCSISLVNFFENYRKTDNELNDIRQLGIRTATTIDRSID
jgi:hypothetical protein